MNGTNRELSTAKNQFFSQEQGSIKKIASCEGTVSVVMLSLITTLHCFLSKCPTYKKEIPLCAP